MTDRAGFFAGLAEVLTALCVYYFVAAVLIVGLDGWGVHLVWLFLWAALSSVVFALVLRRPRGTVLLTWLTLGLFALSLGLMALVSSSALSFRYGLMLVIGGGMASGMPLYLALHRPVVTKHLMYLDVLIITFAALLLVREAMEIDAGAVALMTAALLLDAAGAVGLRMSDGGAGDGANALRACLVALGASAALGLLIWALTALFSRSGAVTGGVLRALGAFFSAIGGALERFFRWLASFARPRELTPLPVEMEEMPSVAAAEGAMEEGVMTVNTTALGIILTVIALAGVILLVVVMRKKRFSRGTAGVAVSSQSVVRRARRGPGEFWRRLWAALRRRYLAFQRRDTPGGLFLRLERLGRRRHTPRRPGETMRAFIRRMDAGGGLDALAEALEREYYGGGGRTLTPKRCRELRKYMRKAVRHG